MAKPIGVAEYQLMREVPPSMETGLPSIDQIEAELRPDLSGGAPSRYHRLASWPLLPILRCIRRIDQPSPELPSFERHHPRIKSAQPARHEMMGTPGSRLGL